MNHSGREAKKKESETEQGKCGDLAPGNCVYGAKLA